MILDASFYCDVAESLNCYHDQNNDIVTLKLRVSERGWIKLESYPNIISWDLGCSNEAVSSYEEITREIKPFLSSFNYVDYIDDLEICTCKSRVQNSGKKSCSMCYESLIIPDKEGYIYAISDKQYVKIGVTKRDPYLRLEDMQTGNAKELKVIKFWNIDNTYSKEEIIHRTLKDKNVRGEWFKLDSKIIGEINNIIYDKEIK